MEDASWRLGGVRHAEDSAEADCRKGELDTLCAKSQPSSQSSTDEYQELGATGFNNSAYLVEAEVVGCRNVGCIVDFLPESLLLEIFSYLKFIDLCRCARVCRRWNRVSKDQTLQKVIDVSDEKPSFEQFNSLVDSYGSSRVLDFRMKALDCDSAQFITYFKAVVELVKKCPNLQKLTLMPNEFDSSVLSLRECASTISLCISDLPNTLVHLCLRDSQIYPDYFFGSSPHKHVPHLQCLDLGRVNNLTSKDLGPFSELKNLQTMYLDGCSRINNGGIEHMIDILPQLCVLDLEGTDITNDGVCCIMENCVSLKELYIGRTACTSEAFFVLSGDMLASLEKLCIRNTHISSQAVHYFLTQSYAGKKVRVTTSWLEIVPQCLTKHNNCRIINSIPEHALNLQCNHFREHVCRKL